MLRKLLVAAATTIVLSSQALAAPAHIMVPAGPGGGYDGTARIVAEGLEKTKLWNEGFNITNKTGGGGMIALAEFVSRNQGNPNALFSMGVILIGAVETTASPIKLEVLAPIARLTQEFGVIAVPTTSPIKTPQDFVAALKANPAAFAVGGGSAGGVDQITLGLIAKDQGIPTNQLNYVAGLDGAQAATMLGGGKLSAAISGVSEFKPLAQAGRIRIIAVTGDKRVEGIDAPTLKESGINVMTTNWRGLMGAPGMSKEAQKSWVDRIATLTKTPEWAALLASKGLDGAYLGGEEFEAFLKTERERIVPVLKDLGLVKS
jgi:putative tricarboxylic transport membrane protein